MRPQAVFQARKVCIISKFRERIIDDVRVESKASFRNEDIRRSGKLTLSILRHEPIHCNGWKKVNNGRMFTTGRVPSKVYNDATFRYPKSIVFFMPQSRQGGLANEVRTLERLTWQQLVNHVHYKKTSMTNLDVYLLIYFKVSCNKHIGSW